VLGEAVALHVRVQDRGGHGVSFCLQGGALTQVIGP
jgi:hypothetical protein